MGNKHGDKWTSALPWVLLGKRAALQPDLDASASMLAFGRSPSLPGQLLGHPGPPLSNLQTKALLEELYKLDNKPAIQTSATVDPIDITFTNNATHVYVKIEEPKGLCPRFEGPYKIVSRPIRSQVEVRVGSHADGSPRLLKFHWSSCKIAHMSENDPEGSRANIGRKPRPDPPTPESLLTSKQPVESTETATRDSLIHETSIPVDRQQSSQPAKRRKFEQSDKSSNADTACQSIPSAPHLNYASKGPVITDQMFEK